jgi:hypothetical protein
MGPRLFGVQNGVVEFSLSSAETGPRPQPACEALALPLEETVDLDQIQGKTQQAGASVIEGPPRYRRWADRLCSLP